MKKSKNKAIHCLLIAIVSLAAPSQAKIFQYSITGGQFQTSAGPGKGDSTYNGSFSGTFSWDTTANGGSGGWTEWNIIMRNNSSSDTQFTFSSVSSGSYLDGNSSASPKPSYNLDPSKGAAAGCFTSPFAYGNAANTSSTGINYSTSSASGLDCRGGSASSGVQSTSGLPSFFNVYQLVNTSPSQPYTWSAGPTGGGFYNYFRIPLTPGPTFLTDGSLSIDSTNQGAQQYGWASMLYDPAADPNNSNTPTNPNSCTGAGSDNSLTYGSCPYAGNTQRKSSLTGAVVTITVDNIIPDPAPPGPSSSVPGPVALFGVGAALSSSRIIRRRIRST